MNAREDILARVRAAQSGVPVPVVRGYRAAGTVPVDIEQFVDRLLDYKAGVRRCRPDEIASVVLSLLGDAPSVLVPEGIPAEWTPGLVVRSDRPELRTEELDAVAAVLTTCAVGIAETGTIILDHGSGQGRRALTLVPDHHVIVVRAEQVVASVPDAVAARRPGAVQTWISGPSATSDIELNRVEGVHGPRRLDVIIAG